MKICIDATGALKFYGGVSRYVRNLITSISELDSSNQYFIYYRYLRSNDKTKLNLSNKVNFYERRNRTPFFIYNRFKKILPITLDYFMPKDIGLIHFPDHELGVSSGYRGKTIVTIHDLFVFVCPHFMDKITINRYSKGIYESIKKSDLILAISQNTKYDLQRLFNIPQEKIRVIYHGYDPILFNNSIGKDQLELLRKKYNLPSRYILTVGIVTPRKNVDGLLKAFELIKEVHPDYQLLVVGKLGWGSDQLLKLWGKSKYRNDIHFIQDATDDCLSVSYRLADMLVYPSFYEGFGFPIIESMACGTPVITSNVSCLPEIAGDAAMLVNPNDVNDIASKIMQIIEQEPLRLSLIEKGLKNVERFSWNKAAIQTIKAYEDLCGK